MARLATTVGYVLAGWQKLNDGVRRMDAGQKERSYVNYPVQSSVSRQHGEMRPRRRNLEDFINVQNI